MTENYTPPEGISPTEEVKADPKRPYKAVAAFVLTLLGLLWASLEGRDNLDNMSLMEWLAIVVPVILTTGTVYGITNPKVIVPARRDDRGAVDALMVILVVVAVLILLAVLGFLR